MTGRIVSLLTLSLLMARFLAGSAFAESAAAATNALGLDLYRLEAASKKGNLLLSPYTIETGLAMAYGAAEGKTRAEMKRTLHLSGEEVIGELATLRQALEGTPSVKLRVANRLFGQARYPFFPAFLKQTRSQWQSPLTLENFAKNPDTARRHINGWVSQQTENRIVDLIPPGGVDKTARMVLVSTLYFKGTWEHPFFKDFTSPQPFYSGGRAAAKVPTMYDVRHFGYSKQKGYSAVTMPYEGGDLQFLVILPDARDGLAAVERGLSADQLGRFSRLPETRNVKLHLPKFKLSPATMLLSARLNALGMKTAFDEPRGTADFSRAAPRTPQDYLGLSEVYHKTFLDLDEKGTEAAAATGTTAFGFSAAPRKEPEPVEVRVDHPFLFAIQHRGSGVCLFLGRVTDPRN